MTRRQLLLVAAFPAALGAQGTRRLPVPAPSRADSMLAAGRLRAAEDALYAAANARPRAPEPRGELGRYLASRARFGIADVLFAEALRFGADTPSVARALLAMAAYRPELDRRRLPGVRLPAAEARREAARLAARAARPDSAGNTDVTVPMTFSDDGMTLGRFEVRGTGGVRTAVLDPAVQGLLVGRAADAALVPTAFGDAEAGAPLLVERLWVGAREIRGVDARVDPSVPEGEVRMGLDVLWPLRPSFDERAGTLAIGAAARPVPAAAYHIPIALGFPGMWLVPAVGEPPVPIASPRGRSLLRASRWWWDAAEATIVVER